MIMLGFFISGYVFPVVLVPFKLGWLDCIGVQAAAPHLNILESFSSSMLTPSRNFAENPKFFNDSLCSRWCNCTSGNLMPFSESYDCKGSGTSCSDRFVYIYVLDGILVAALIWAVCYGCHLTCTIYLGSFSVPPLHLALLAH